MNSTMRAAYSDSQALGRLRTYANLVMTNTRMTGWKSPSTGTGSWLLG